MRDLATILLSSDKAVAPVLCQQCVDAFEQQLPMLLSSLYVHDNVWDRVGTVPSPLLSAWNPKSFGTHWRSTKDVWIKYEEANRTDLNTNIYPIFVDHYLTSIEYVIKGYVFHKQFLQPFLDLHSVL